MRVVTIITSALFAFPAIAQMSIKPAQKDAALEETATASDSALTLWWRRRMNSALKWAFFLYSSGSP